MDRGNWRGSSPQGCKKSDTTKATEHARMYSLVFLVHNVITWIVAGRLREVAYT